MVFGSVISNNNEKLQLISTKIEGNIAHTFSTLTYSQVFENKNNFPVNATLFVNGGMDYVIYNVKILNNESVLTFELKEIDEAKAIFQEEFDDGNFSGYAELESSDAMKFTLGNIEANSKISVQIETTFGSTMLTSNSYSFKLPHRSEFSESKISANIKYQTLTPFQSITHHGLTGDIKIISEDELNGAIIINESKFEQSPSIIFNFSNNYVDSAISTKIGEYNYIGLSISPDLPVNSEIQSEIFLVIDCSGSMSGAPIKVALETLKLFIRSLPPKCFFNVVRFGSTFEVLFEESAPYDKIHFDDAIAKADIMDANLGGTDLLSPMTYIFGKPTKPGFVRQVFILTDGQVENESEILALATKNRNTHRVFSLGIGKSISRGFIEEIAKCSNGSATFVESNDIILSSVMSQLAASLKPAVVSSQIHVEGIESVEISPFPIPTFFSNYLSHIYIKLPENISTPPLLVNGKFGEIDYETSLIPIKVLNNIRLDKLFGFFNIRDLEEKLTLASPDEIPIIKKNTIELSLQYGIVSQFTALHSMLDGKPIIEQVETQEEKKETQVLQQQEIPIRGKRTNFMRSNINQAPRQFSSKTNPSSGGISSVQALNQRQQRSCKRSYDISNNMFQPSIPSPAQNWGSVSIEQTKPKSMKQRSRPTANQTQNSPGFFQKIGNFFSFSNSSLQSNEIDESNINQPITIYSMNTLLSMQTFEGYWNKDKDLINFVNNKLPNHLIPQDQFDEITYNNIIGTIIALTLLDKNENNKRDIWGLLENKGLNWLNSINNNINWKDIINQYKNEL